MKKTEKSLLADVSLEMTPLTEDSEGMLRGGFSGLGSSDVDAVNNGQCANVCINKKCTPGQDTNDDCENKKCINYCTNEDCTTTKTTVPSGGQSLGLLI